MKYNTKREPLTIPEYGRHVQKMISHAVAISDKVEQQKSIWWIPRHLEMMKGVGNCEKLRRVEHKH